MNSPAYKVKADKELLKEFFSIPLDRVTEKHLKEIHKVFLIVFIQYYSKFFHLKEDLYQDALTAIFKRHDQYDSKFQAYNYIYTVFRNEIGNRIKFYTKEISSEELLPKKDESKDIPDIPIPEFIERFSNELLGRVEYNYVRIPRSCAIPMLMFLTSQDNVKIAVPDYVNAHAAPVLYKILNDLLDE